MEHIIYKGQVGIDDFFPCTMCRKISKFEYLKYPHPAIQHLYRGEERLPIKICKACAKREIGSKNKKGWKQLHEETT